MFSFSQNNRTEFLDIDIIHFGRLTGAFYQSPVEIYSYLLRNYVNNSQNYSIEPRQSAYLVPCNEQNIMHRIGDGLCQFLYPEQPYPIEKINAVLIRNESRREKIEIKIGDSIQDIRECPYATVKQVEIPGLLIPSRAKF